MKLFTRHPHSVGETYLQHSAFALRYGARMTLGGLAALVHGVFPFLFDGVASCITRELHGELERSPARAQLAAENR